MHEGRYKTALILLDALYDLFERVAVKDFNSDDEFACDIWDDIANMRRQVRLAHSGGLDE